MAKKKSVRVLIIIAVGASLLAAFFLREQRLRRREIKLPAETNVLLITLDTTRADHIGAYGYHPARTPSLNRLAGEGCLFENGYTPVPLTLPSHASLLTGKNPLSHGVRNNGHYVLNENEVTLPEVLKEQGYVTFAAVGSYILHSKFGLGQGFDIYDDGLSLDEVHHNYDSEISADAVYRKFRRWFEKKSAKPFFAWVHFFDPHAPYAAPKEIAAEEGDIGAYDAEIAYMDIYIGKLVQDLESSGLLEKTLVVIAGDHGEAFGEHGEKGHGIFCYDDVLRVPLIFCGPIQESRGRRVLKRVSLTDVMPTILGLFGFDIPEAVEGRTFASLLSGREEKDRTVYFESFFGQEEKNWAPLSGLIDGPFKYLSLPEPELYNLKTDPSERDNIVAMNRKTAEKLASELETFSAARGREAGGGSKRGLTPADVERLKSLGYLAPETRQKGPMIDPKKGIVIQNRLDEVKGFLEKGDFGRAGRELMSLMGANPDVLMPVMYDLKHKILMSEKKLDEAVKALEEGVRNFPGFTPFRITLASYFFGFNEYERSETLCRHILETDPAYTRAYTLLGDIQSREGKIGEAISLYQKAVEIEPRNVSLRIALADLLVRGRKFEMAVAVVNEAAQSEDFASNPEILLSIGILNAAYGTPAKAVTFLESVILMKPSGPAYFHYARALAETGKLREAVQAMELALDRYRSGLDAEQSSTGREALRSWRERLEPLR